MRVRTLWPWALAGPGFAILLLLVADYYRGITVVDEPLLAVSFEHTHHRETACADCHHNFVDGSGGGTCYNCHKYTSEIAADIEKTFHGFCMACHVKTRKAGDDSGPMRPCSGCHEL